LGQGIEREFSAVCEFGNTCLGKFSIETSVLYSEELCASLVGSCFSMTHARESRAVVGVSGLVGGGGISGGVEAFGGALRRQLRNIFGFLEMSVHLDRVSLHSHAFDATVTPEEDGIFHSW